MSVWSGTIPNQRPRWLLLVLTIVAWLVAEPEGDPPVDDGPDDNWGGW